MANRKKTKQKRPSKTVHAQVGSLLGKENSPQDNRRGAKQEPRITRGKDNEGAKLSSRWHAFIAKTIETLAVIAGLLAGGLSPVSSIAALWTLYVAICLAIGVLFWFAHGQIRESQAQITPPIIASQNPVPAPTPEHHPVIIPPPSANSTPQLPEARRAYLTPGNAQSPELKLPDGEDDPPEDALLLLMGDLIVWADRFPHRVIMQNGEEMLTINRNADGIAISARFFAKDGTIICKIVENEFIVNPDNIFYMNRTDHRLTVYDKQDRVVFDVEYLNKRHVRMLGDYYIRESKRIIITHDSQTIRATHSGVNLYGGNMVDFNF